MRRRSEQRTAFVPQDDATFGKPGFSLTKRKERSHLCMSFAFLYKKTMFGGSSRG